MTSERASIFGKPASKIDVSGFAPRGETTDRPKVEDLEELTRGSKFKSREGAEPAAPRSQQRRRRTGRNVQFNIRATQQVIDNFKAVSEQMDWPDGLTLEKALEALKRELSR